jgi:hypothetical protein
MRVDDPVNAWMDYYREPQGEPNVVVHPYGDVAVAGPKTKVQPPSVKRNDLEMDDTPRSRINLKKIVEDEPEMWNYLKEIMSPAAFLAVFVPSFDMKACRMPRRISRGMLRHLPKMIQNDLVDADPDVVLAALTVFLVAKKSGLGRFIHNCKWLNEQQTSPGQMGLPMMKEWIRTILSWDYANQCDGDGYFYQFVFHKEIRPWFGMRLAAERGKIAEVVMKRMSMGWKFSPRIAQRTSNFLMNDLGLAWVDNFGWGGDTEEEFYRKSKILAGRFQRYNVKVDADVENLKPLRKFTSVGLEFDLERK